MRQLNFVGRKQPAITIVVPTDDGSKEIVLTRRRVLVGDSDEHDAKMAEIKEAYHKKEISDIEFTFQVIEHLVEGFVRDDFRLLQVYHLKEIVEAVGELAKEPKEQKKTE